VPAEVDVVDEASVIASIRDLTAKTGRAPTAGEVGAALNVSRQHVHRLLQSALAAGRVVRTGPANVPTYEVARDIPPTVAQLDAAIATVRRERLAGAYEVLAAMEAARRELLALLPTGGAA